MKDILTQDSVVIPEGITATVSRRHVTIKGPRGTLERSFKHKAAAIELVGKKKKQIIVSIYFAARKEAACVRTICSHIKNMITGVTSGYQYKMRMVYAHFPINVNTNKDGSELEIKNYLGEKITRNVKMLAGVKIVRSENVKDEVVLTGNSIELVSQSAANIHQACAVLEKDIRKFLDGIYVSEKGVLGK